MRGNRGNPIRVSSFCSSYKFEGNIGKSIDSVYNKIGVKGKKVITVARYYQLTKKITEEMAQKMEEELRDLENVKTAEFTEDLSKLKMETVDGDYVDVMNRAVNICRRIGGGCDLSFAGFACESL